MPDTSKREKLNRELEKSEKKLRKAINDEKALQHPFFCFKINFYFINIIFISLIKFIKRRISIFNFRIDNIFTTSVSYTHLPVSIVTFNIE